MYYHFSIKHSVNTTKNLPRYSPSCPLPTIFFFYNSAENTQFSFRKQQQPLDLK